MILLPSSFRHGLINENDYYINISHRSFIISRMSEKNKMALVFIFGGLIGGIVLSVILPEEKLVYALVSSNALVGVGLSQWSSTQNENEDEDEDE